MSLPSINLCNKFWYINPCKCLVNTCISGYLGLLYFSIISLSYNVHYCCYLRLWQKINSKWLEQMYKILGWGHYKRFLFCKSYLGNFICCMVRGDVFPQNPITNTLQSVWFSSTTYDINTPTLPPQVCLIYKK